MNTFNVCFKDEYYYEYFSIILKKKKNAHDKMVNYKVLYSAFSCI